MAIPWLSALKAIPWGNVIEHAPSVLDKARDLIDKHRKPSQPVTEEDDLQKNETDLAPHDQLENRLANALDQIKSIQQKNDQHALKIIDLENKQELILKDIRRLKNINRWLLFMCFMVVFVSFAIWILYSQKFIYDIS